MEETKPDTRVRLIDDPMLETFSLKDAGFTGLVYGNTGAGKTLSIRKLAEYLGPEEVVVVATDPRMAPLEGLGVKILRCWMEPSISEGPEMKTEAARVWNVMTDFHRLLSRAAANPKVRIPKVVVHDNLTLTADIKAAMISGTTQMSQPQWGQFGREMMALVSFYRGLQIRGLVRIICCTSGWDTDEMGRRVPVLYIGTSGGKIAPKGIPLKIDFMFNITASYEPNSPEAGPDGMLRRFQTCEMNGVIAKGAPQLPTPYMAADWGEVYRKVIEGKS